MATDANRDSDLWLPADFFYGDFHVKENRQIVDEPAMSEDSTIDCQDDDYIAKLASRMASSFLHDGDDKSLPQFASDNTKGRNWMANNGSNNMNDNAPLAYSPVSPLERQISGSEKGYTTHHRKLHELELSSARNSIINHRRLRESHFHRLREQQLMKQHFATSYHSGRPLGLSPEAWPPLTKSAAVSQPQPEPTMIPKKMSAGTGVFLPRPAVAKEPRKKQGCSPVVVPARVVHALKLNLDELDNLRRIPGGYIFDHDALISRGNGGLSNQRANWNRP